MMLQRAEPRLRFDRVIRTQRFGSAAPWALGLALNSLVLVARLASAQPTSNEAPIEFAIAAQPLVSALRHYGDMTGREAIYDASLATGRTAGQVRGLLAPAEALERLLAGTGLSARFVADGAFILSMTPPAIGAPTTIIQSPEHRRYYALIQENLLDALCRLGSARPSHYRIVGVFRIGASGAVENARRIGSTGTADADQQIDATLRSVRFSEPPPAGFAQPVRILIVPDAQTVTPACANADARLRANEGGR